MKDRRIEGGKVGNVIPMGDKILSAGETRCACRCIRYDSDDDKALACGARGRIKMWLENSMANLGVARTFQSVDVYTG
jgi:hypothetical protein